MSSKTKTLTPSEIASTLSTALNQPIAAHAIHDFDDHYAIKLMYSGTLENEHLKALTSLGAVKIKRSGAGISIQLEIIK